MSNSPTMKLWQKGYDLEYLKELERRWQVYNDLVLSPFGKMKKNNIADLLSKDEYIRIIDGNNVIGYMETSICKVRTPIKMYQDIIIGFKEKGDRIIHRLSYNDTFLSRIVNALQNIQENCWLFSVEGQYKIDDIAEKAGFKKVGIKINTFADIFHVYYKGEQRVTPEIQREELINIAKVNIRIPQPLLDSLLNTPPPTEYENHYSNYNKDKSWSAIALVGYSKDPKMIEKPIEMSDEWKEKHKNDAFFIQHTTAFKRYSPIIETLLKLIPAQYHRVRLMKLKSGGGELSRHTDQVDPELGVKDGRLMRLHIPLKTNDGVIFSSWDVSGAERKVNMKVGECWYLDIRKPHKAINNGDEERIHLVIDVEANDEIRRLL